MMHATSPNRQPCSAMKSCFSEPPILKVLTRTRPELTIYAYKEASPWLYMTDFFLYRTGECPEMMSCHSFRGYLIQGDISLTHSSSI